MLCGILGGRGGGEVAAGDTAWFGEWSRAGGGGGGGGGTEPLDINCGVLPLAGGGGGTPNLGGVVSPSSSGVFAGRGGGGGPGWAALEVPRALDGGVGAIFPSSANLPASAIGGGARKFQRLGPAPAGDESLAGLPEPCRSGPSGRAPLLTGGGAGAGPLLVEPPLPLCCGLIDGGAGGVFCFLSTVCASPCLWDIHF